MGKEALDRAKDHACGHGIKAETTLLTGDAARALVQYADDSHADLVCVHSERKGRPGSLFLGSVSRGLAIASSHSVPISKGWIAPSGKLKVVFATDHSDYADKALAKFIEMAPQGIKSIKVVTALHLNDIGGHFDIVQMDSSIERWLVETGVRKNEDAVEKLRNAGYSSSGEVYNLPVNEAISEAMKSTHADLLVMGAQGHGFMYRLALGSTSLHQVVVEPYPILIIRP